MKGASATIMEEITIDIREWLRDYTAIRGANISVNQLSSRRGVTTFSVTKENVSRWTSGGDVAEVRVCEECAYQVR